MKKNFYAIILSFLLVNLIFGFSTQTTFAQGKQPRKYQGAQEQIAQFLCTPNDASIDPTAGQSDLFNCINKVYRFALVIASVFGVFMLVIAGYIYMAADGNEEAVTKAKDIITTTIASLVILAAGYILLKFLNPDLVKFQPIQPAITGGKKDLWAGVTDAQVVAMFGVEQNNKTTSKTIGKPYTGTSNFPASGGTPIAIAASQLGAREDCCDNNGEGLNKGSEINKYFVPNGSQGQPWCSYFTSWAYGQAGYATIGNASGRGGSLSLSSFLQNKNNQTIKDGSKTYKILYFTKADLSQGKASPQDGHRIF